jgi:hypothetical protein
MASGTPGPSSSDLMQSLSADLTALVRQEFRQLQAELTDTARRAGRGGVLLGGAAVLGAMALGTSTALLVRLLERRLGPGGAATVATVLLGAGAGALATAGLAELRRAWPLVPEETLASVRDDVRAASEANGPAARP